MSEAASSAADVRERLIIGLGNPGQDYSDTRHNLGFRVVDGLSQRWRCPAGRLRCNALVTESSKVLLVAPQTYMNRSGYSVRCLVQERQAAPEDVLVVYDDVALPLGRIRLRPAGGPGGHRGMESIVQNLQTESIPRLRLGVAWDEEKMAGVDLVEFVLAEFESSESEVVREMIERAMDACESWLQEGSEATMNRFNG